MTTTTKPSRFKRLRDNSWGAAVYQAEDLTGHTIEITRKDETTTQAVLIQRVALYRDDRHPALYQIDFKDEKESRDERFRDYLARKDALAADPTGRTISQDGASIGRKGYSMSAVLDARKFIANAIHAYEFEADIPKDVGQSALAVFDAMSDEYVRRA